MDAGKKWLLVSPFSGELHHVNLIEAARLLRQPVDALVGLRSALDRAEAAAADELPAELPDGLGGEEGWRVCAAYRARGR